MMYRAGWGHKDDGQRRILAIDIRRKGFDWALQNAQLAREQKSPANVIVQWDPERDLAFAPLPYRSLQMGLRDEAVQRYVNEWILRIEDITPLAHQLEKLCLQGESESACWLLPREIEYGVSPEVRARLGMGANQI